jgi:hypothetical protein
MHNARDHERTHPDTSTIPSRRRLLAGLSATLLAGAAIATAAHGATADAAMAAGGGDAEWISLCDRLVVIAAEEATIYATMTEEEQEVALEPFTQEYRQIGNRIWDLDNPTTPAGFLASARAAVARAPKDWDGNIALMSHGLSELLAFAAMEGIAAQAGGAPADPGRVHLERGAI